MHNMLAELLTKKIDHIQVYDHSTIPLQMAHVDVYAHIGM